MFRLVGETYVEFDFYRCYLLGLRGVVVSPQLGNQVTGVLGSVDNQGLGDNQQSSSITESCSSEGAGKDCSFLTSVPD